MATTDDLTLRMRAQGARQASRDVDRTAGSVRGLGKQSGIAFRSMTKLGGGLRAIGGGAAAFAVAGGTMAAVLGKQSVDAASDLNEVLSKTRVIFKDSAGGIIRWSETTADALGLSQQQALAAASGMGNLLVPMGVARKRAGQMSKRMVTLAGDMASFNNASPEETLGALQSAFIGEYDPVQRFGAAITAARVESEAMRKTHKKSTKDLTAAEKAQAAYNLILKDTKDQQGDFGRTSDGLANAQRRLAATWENLKAAMGTPLLDIVRRAVNGLIEPLTHVTNVASDVFADKNLNWQEKLSRVGRSIRHWFGPAASEIGHAVEDAFRSAAGKAASVFVTEFKNAPAWVHFLTGAFLLSKAGSAFSALGSRGCASFGPKFTSCVGSTMTKSAAKGGALAVAAGAVGTAMGAAAAVAIGLALVDYFASEEPGKRAEGANPEGVRPHHKTPPGQSGMDIWGKRHPDPGSTGGSFGASPGTLIPQLNVHSTLNVDGKPVARSVERASRKKKATR